MKIILWALKEKSKIFFPPFLSNSSYHVCSGIAEVTLFEMEIKAQKKNMLSNPIAPIIQHNPIS